MWHKAAINIFSAHRSSPGMALGEGLHFSYFITLYRARWDALPAGFHWEWELHLSDVSWVEKLIFISLLQLSSLLLTQPFLLQYKMSCGHSHFHISLFRLHYNLLLAVLSLSYVSLEQLTYQCGDWVSSWESMSVISFSHLLNIKYYNYCNSFLAPTFFH